MITIKDIKGREQDLTRFRIRDNREREGRSQVFATTQNGLRAYAKSLALEKILDDSPEPVVETLESFWRHECGVRGIHAVKRKVAIHGGDKGECAGRAYQPVALGEHEQIFRSIVVQMMDADTRAELLITLFGNLIVVRGEIDVDFLVLVPGGKAVDMAGVGLVVVAVDAIVPLDIVTTTDMDTQTNHLLTSIMFSFAHLLAHRLCILAVDAEKVADL